LVTGFLQAGSVSIRPTLTDEVPATHVVSFRKTDLAPFASFSTPAPSGIVHFMGSTLQFFQVTTSKTQELALRCCGARMELL
jgi:hypothetical protein